MSKQPIYVSVSHHQLIQHPEESPWEFKIEVEREFLPVFEKIFNQIEDIEVKNFLRAHLPYIPYHLDKENDKLDLRTKKLYALIHEFGDEETKKFVEKLPYFN